MPEALNPSASKMDDTISTVRKSLPFLPGYQFRFSQNRNYRKSHAFDYSNQVAVFKEDRPGIGMTRI
jgi:hypothetical protein